MRQCRTNCQCASGKASSILNLSPQKKVVCAHHLSIVSNLSWEILVLTNLFASQEIVTCVNAETTASVL